MDREQRAGWYDRDIGRRPDWYRQSAQDAQGGNEGAQVSYLAAGALMLGVGGYLLYLGARDMGSGATRQRAKEGVRGVLGQARQRAEEFARKRGGDKGIEVRERVTVNRPASELYRFWRDVENLPRVMGYLERVTKTSDRKSHWVAKGPGGQRVEWDAEITDERDNDFIAWRSLEGAEVPNEGSVRFTRSGDGSGTDVEVRLTYHPPGGEVGRAMASMFGREPGQEVRRDLERFRDRVQSGELSLGAASQGGSFGTI